MLPLHRLKDWSPFHLDALGLVTLLGAEEVSNAIGALEHSSYMEYLPLFGTYLVAANKFTRPIPGFALYNISDGVYIPILNGWFSRWLIANLTDKITVLTCEPRLEKRSIITKELSAMFIGFIANGALIVIAALQGDYYGLANVIAMAISVIVRLAMVHENRKHLNQIVDKYFDFIQSPKSSVAAIENAKAWVKIVVTAPEDKVVVFKMRRRLVGCIIADLDVVENKTGSPEELILNMHQPSWQRDDDALVTDKSKQQDPELAQKAHSHQLSSQSSALGANVSSKSSAGITHLYQRDDLTSPGETVPVHDTSITARPIARVSAHEPENVPENVKLLLNNRKVSHSNSYTVARGVGWITFAIHVICIGQSSLLDQILSVGLLVCSTLLTIYNFGNDNVVGNRLVIQKAAALDNHKDAYLALQPTEEEQRVLRHYLRLPYKPEHNRYAMGTWNDEWWTEWKGRFSD